MQKKIRETARKIFRCAFFEILSLFIALPLIVKLADPLHYVIDHENPTRQHAMKGVEHMQTNWIALIPAYQPDEHLIQLLQQVR
ncbi:MAG: hypothetical protein LUC50_09510 [Ruminococcus sp.]|nr:hypothetical protein [Ruminococcus sp.]